MPNPLTVETITLYPFAIPLKAPFRIATMVNRAAEGVFVRLTSGNLEAWGECLPFHAINGEDQATVLAALRRLAPALLGQDATTPAPLVETLFALLPAQTSAISGLDIALHDLAAQAVGLPLATYLGAPADHQGQTRPLPTDLTIGIKNPAEAAAQTVEIIGQGVTTIKIKLGDSPQADIARVHAVRDAAQKHTTEQINIRVDANQAYDRLQALEVLTAIAPAKIQFCEQPVRREDHAGLAFLHQRSPVPVMADESCFSPQDAFQLLANQSCHLLNVKLCKSGGLHRARQIATVARAAHARCMMGGMAETRLGVTAAAALAAADPAFHFFDLDAHTGHTTDPIEGGINIHQGQVHLPKTPGLGAKPHPQHLNTLPPIPISPTP